MNKWAELSNVFPDPIQEIWDGDSEGSKWLDDVMAEGDLLLREKRSLLIYAKMLRDENTRLEKHNVFLLNEIDKVLGDE